MMVRIPPDQVMAILRLRQWAYERAAIRHGRNSKLEFSGWKGRRNRDADSRHVRVIDFERALGQLDPLHQQILVLAYRDNVPRDQAAKMLGISPRQIYYLLPAVRSRLAEILDRLDLL
jgi:DNA-directed RNA polymerase specialized sigma24 family protein